MMSHFTLPERDGEGVRRLLQAHERYARMSGAKTFALHLLAVVSVALWIGAMWPALLPPTLLDDALGLWVALVFFAVLASIEEWLWRRQVAQYRRGLKPTCDETRNPAP
jgi:membrane protein implicated in regulation of membrane protease activity